MPIKLKDITVAMVPNKDPIGCKLYGEYRVTLNKIIFTEEIKCSKVDIVKLNKDRIRNEIYKHITGNNPPKSEGDSKNSEQQRKYKISLNTIERLEAVSTIIGGTSVPSREELNCANEELEIVIEKLRTFL